MVSMETKNSTINKMRPEDARFHDWYRFVLSFPPHLPRQYINEFVKSKDAVVLDPFCGTGTTLIEAKLYGLASIGVEANPIAKMASEVKTDWSPNPADLQKSATKVLSVAQKIDNESTEPLSLSEEKATLLISGSIEQVPLHRLLAIKEAIAIVSPDESAHLLLALAKTAVESSNLKFSPEVGARGHRHDVAVYDLWLANVLAMANDLASLDEQEHPKTRVVLADSRSIDSVLGSKTVDMVFTSPPYPNEKDYTRATRLESVLLDLIESREGLRTVKDGLLRSNTRNVYVKDDDDIWVKDNEIVSLVTEEIERVREQRNKTSGFERLYAKTAKLYFGGMARHLSSLRGCLSDGAVLCYVVGDQASYLQVMIRTGQILSGIAEKLGYEVVRIDQFRTRLATATGQQLAEEVLVLRWNG